ncbi:hypothetical protein IV417_00950 [Alphaproteobacteria bacterium KMM 3653]|uniref:Energy transducer TonB n=1 Tax=Harenicola maris TaxID=2841044 RepID=A0AAP2CK57_9RHOB|nr:hypothetical protein [Harenicola maris]
MDVGTVVSAGGHLGLIGWALLGGLFQSHDPQDAMQVTEVTMMTSEEFAALTAAPSAEPAEVITPEPEAPEPETEEPVQPEPEVTPPAPQTPPEPELAPEPPAAETVPEEPVQPEPEQPAAAETAPEAPEPLPETQVVTAPPEITAPTPEVEDTPEGAALVLDTSARPKPRPAARVAPTPAVQPEPDAAAAPDVQEAANPEESDQAEQAEEVQEAAAPEAAATEIVTEAETPTGGEVVSDLAPTGAPRPPSRPARLAERRAEAVAAQEAAREAAQQAAQETPSQSATQSAVEEALASGTQSTTPSGPPLTAGEKDALRIAVQQCWNVGSLSSEALRVTVTVSVKMQQNGKPDTGSLRMVGAEGGSQAAAKQAYEAARRAIILCGNNGFNLPAEKYSQWREIEMVFNPERMRIK